ncbi:DUF4468 domain-containing protein [Sphingobacterium lactis]|uniref:DUF4468 domain-containing protein n=1 Tax=Sphingobacterium lactis TaxID=797291 RepID=UPI003EC6BF4D
MKKYQLLMMLSYFIIMTSCAVKKSQIPLIEDQELPLVGDKIVYEAIIEDSELSKAEMYAASKRFIANTFKSAKSVIQTEDESTGLIICKGITTIKHPESRTLVFSSSNVGGYKSFTMQFESKEGRCRVKIYDIIEDNSLSQYSRSFSLEEILLDLAKKVNDSQGENKIKRKLIFNESVLLVNSNFYALLDSFKESVSQYKSNDDW